MIAARTLKSKQAIDDLVDSGEDMEDIEIAASNAEKALNSIGLSTRASNGDLKDLEVILGEVAGKWDTLSDATKQYVSEQLAGNNRRSYFIGLMENYGRVEELQTKAENSSGKLMEASEKKANSLEGQLNKLQNAWYRLYEAMLGSGVAKGGVQAITAGINGLAKAMENLHIILPAVATSALVFRAAINGWTIVDQIKWIGMLAKETLTLLIGKLGLATAAANGLNLAMLGLKTLGIGAVVGLGIYAITNLIKKNKEAQESFENLSGSVETLKGELEELDARDTTLANYANAKKELDSMVEGTEEYKAKQEELNQLESEISGYGEQYHSILNNQYLSVEDQIEAMERLIALEEKQAVQDKLDGFTQKTVDDNVDNYHDAIGSARYKQQQLDEAKKALAEEYTKLEQTRNQAEIEQINKNIAQKEREIKQYQEARDEYTKKAMEYLEDIENYNALLKEAEAKGVDTDFLPANISEASQEQLAELIKLLGDVGDKAEETTQKEKEAIQSATTLQDAVKTIFNEDYKDDNFAVALDALNNVFKSGKFEAEDMTKALEILKAQFPELLANVNDFGQAVETLNGKSLNDQYVEQVNLLQEAQELLNTINEEGLTPANLTTLQGSELMRDYTGSILDSASVVDHLKNKLQELSDAQYETSAAMVLNNDKAWNQMTNDMANYLGLQNSNFAKSLGLQEGDFANFVNSLGGMRQVDVNNAANSAEAQRQMEADLCRQAISYYAQMVNSKSGNRKTDMINVAEFLGQQKVKEAKTVQELAQMWAEFYNAKAKAINAEINSLNKKVNEMNQLGNSLDTLEGFEDMVMGKNGVSGAAKHQFSNLQSQLKNLTQMNDNFTNFFANINTALGGVSGGLSQSLAGASGIKGNAISGSGRPSSGSGSGGSGSGRPSSGSGSGGSGGSGSGSEKTVEDMELEIDRYYALQDAIENVNKALAKNQALQENVRTKAEYKKLIEEEINLTNQKIKALENLRKEQLRERDELKASLRQNGFAFDSNNNITNYANRLRQLQNWANGITNPDQKEAAIAQVNAIKEMIDKYTELEDSTIPSTTEEINNLKNEIISINKEFKENMKLIDALGDRYFDVLRKIAKVENELALNQAKQDNANDYERIDLLGKEIELLLKRQQLVKEQRDEANKEANELKNQLVGKGVKFDNNGSITNYKALVKSLEDKANGLVGDAQAEAVEEAQDILDLIDKYVTLTEDTLPSLETEWEKYTTQIQDSKDTIDEIFRSFKQTVTDVQKDIASAYEKYQTERYNKLQEALDKEVELYNKAYEEENFNRDLSKQQRELEEIAQQIAIYSRDTSEAGKARLEQLRKEYEEQQQAINDMIRDKEKDNANDRFDEVSESLDKELEDLLAPEKLVATVNDAIANGMITIGEETMKLDDLMTTWLNDTGDGLYALGDILKSELVENLEKAQDIIGKMNVNGFTMKAPTTTNDKLQSEIDKLKNTSVNGDMNFSLVVQGDVTKDSMPKLEKELKNMENRIYANIAKSLK